MSALQNVHEALEAQGLSLPIAPEAKGNYLPYVRSGNLVFISGALPIANGEIAYKGQVGGSQTVASGYKAAQLCVLNSLAILREASKDFEKLDRIVSVAGFVNGINGFSQSPAVINGASDLLVAVFGKAGKHARTAVSSNGLPLEAAVEIQLTASILP